MEIDFTKLTDEQVEAIVDRLFPVIRRKITLRSETTPFGQQVKGLGGTHELTLKVQRGGVTTIDNPLKKKISGHILVQGAPYIDLSNNKPKKLTFNTGAVSIGKKIKILVY